jgi:MFS family permease
LRAGLRYTWSRPDLLLALSLAFLVGTFGLNTQVTIALMARQEFHLGAEAFGLLTTFFAVGSLTGALVSARRSSRPRERFLVLGVIAFGSMCAIAGLMPGYAWFAAMLVPTGAAAMVFTVANNSFVQLGADPQMRGRVMALYFMCLTGGMPIGSPVIGLVAEHLGAPWAFVLSGSLLVTAGLCAAGLLARRHRREATGSGVLTPGVQSPIGAA